MKKEDRYRGYSEKIILGGKKVYREWWGDCWAYDAFNTHMYGELTSTDSPVDGVCPEGQFYKVFLRNGDEQYSRYFGRYSEAQAWLDRARTARSIVDALVANNRQ